jgi:uncharacterized damage-inducible protein DinB
MIDFSSMYDVLTQAREKLFDWIRPLSQEQYTKEFPFGVHTLQTTIVELAGTERWLAMRAREEPFPVPFSWDDTARRVDLATQLLMHEVHHRAQAMAMLRQFGIEAQDLDYIDFVQKVRREPREP